MGFALLPLISQVLPEVAPTFGFNSLPSHIHVFEEEEPTLGLISLPVRIHVFEEEAAVLGFSSVPLHTQLLGRSILGIYCSLVMVLGHSVCGTRGRGFTYIGEVVGP